MGPGNGELDLLRDVNERPKLSTEEAVELSAARHIECPSVAKARGPGSKPFGTDIEVRNAGPLIASETSKADRMAVLIQSLISKYAPKTRVGAAVGEKTSAVDGRRHNTGARLVLVPKDMPVLTVADVGGWSRWLAEHGRQSEGVWLVLAKKATAGPTSLSYDEALEEAICHGWVDGQLSKGDERMFRRRFTPRRAGSAWSKRNVSIANKLLEEGRVRSGGLAVIERAKADGSWGRAYEGQASIEVPPDLATALAADPAALAVFEQLDAANRYAVLYRLATAKREETRRRRVEQFVAMLARGETIHPQRAQPHPAGPEG